MATESVEFDMFKEELSRILGKLSLTASFRRGMNARYSHKTPSFHKTTFNQGLQRSGSPLCEAILTNARASFNQTFHRWEDLLQYLGEKPLEDLYGPDDRLYIVVLTSLQGTLGDCKKNRARGAALLGNKFIDTLITRSKEIKAERFIPSSTTTVLSFHASPGPLANSQSMVDLLFTVTALPECETEDHFVKVMLNAAIHYLDSIQCPPLPNTDRIGGSTFYLVEHECEHAKQGGEALFALVICHTLITIVDINQPRMTCFVKFAFKALTDPQLKAAWYKNVGYSASPSRTFSRSDVFDALYYICSAEHPDCLPTLISWTKQICVSAGKYLLEVFDAVETRLNKADRLGVNAFSPLVMDRSASEQRPSADDIDGPTSRFIESPSPLSLPSGPSDSSIQQLEVPSTSTSSSSTSTLASSSEKSTEFLSNQSPVEENIVIPVNVKTVGATAEARTPELSNNEDIKGTFKCSRCSQCPCQFNIGAAPPTPDIIKGESFVDDGHALAANDSDLSISISDSSSQANLAEWVNERFRRASSPLYQGPIGPKHVERDREFKTVQMTMKTYVGLQYESIKAIKDTIEDAAEGRRTTVHNCQASQCSLSNVLDRFKAALVDLDEHRVIVEEFFSKKKNQLFSDPLWLNDLSYGSGSADSSIVSESGYVASGSSAAGTVVPSPGRERRSSSTSGYSRRRSLSF